MKDLGILDLLRLAGFKAEDGDRIVRHQDDRYPVSELLALDLLEVYQAYQSRPVFHKARHVVSLTGLDGTRAKFVGVFRNHGWRDSADGPSLTTHPLEDRWRSETKFFYRLERMAGFEAFEDRVIVEWGRGALAWCQRLSNKPVLEISPPGRRLPPFRDYLEFSLSYDELVDLYRNEDAHPEWRSHLSAVAGVYLILADTSGELYVGSATGAEGIWGRWRDYAKTGHGNSKSLKALVTSDPRYPKAFRFSVLQILPKSMSREDVVEREVRFKAKLGSLAHGLNLN